MAAYIAPMKNTAAIITVVLIPTTFDTSSSSPMARTAFPKVVIFSRSSNPTNPAIATPMVKTLKPLMFAPATVHGALPKVSGRGRGALWNTMVVAAVIASRMPSDANQHYQRRPRPLPHVDVQPPVQRQPHDSRQQARHRPAQV